MNPKHFPIITQIRQRSEEAAAKNQAVQQQTEDLKKLSRQIAEGKFNQAKSELVDRISEAAIAAIEKGSAEGHEEAEASFAQPLFTDDPTSNREMAIVAWVEVARQLADQGYRFSDLFGPRVSDGDYYFTIFWWESYADAFFDSDI